MSCYQHIIVELVVLLAPKAEIDLLPFQSYRAHAVACITYSELVK